MFENVDADKLCDVARPGDCRGCRPRAPVIVMRRIRTVDHSDEIVARRTEADMLKSAVGQSGQLGRADRSAGRGVVNRAARDRQKLSGGPGGVLHSESRRPPQCLWRGWSSPGATAH